MIRVRGFFSNWKEVDREQAKRFVIHHLNGIITTGDPEKKAAMIEGKYLQGITVKELLQ